jgi:hypothetical protein
MYNRRTICKKLGLNPPLYLAVTEVQSTSGLILSFSYLFLVNESMNSLYLGLCLRPSLNRTDRPCRLHDTITEQAVINAFNTLLIQPSVLEND